LWSPVSPALNDIGHDLIFPNPFLFTIHDVPFSFDPAYISSAAEAASRRASQASSPPIPHATR